MTDKDINANGIIMPEGIAEAIFHKENRYKSIEENIRRSEDKVTQAVERLSETDRKVATYDYLMKLYHHLVANIEQVYQNMRNGIVSDPKSLIVYKRCMVDKYFLEKAGLWLPEYDIAMEKAMRGEEYDKRGLDNSRLMSLLDDDVRREVERMEGR